MIIELKKGSHYDWFNVFHRKSIHGQICRQGANKFSLSDGKYRVVAKNPKEKGFNKIIIQGVEVKHQLGDMVVGWDLLTFLAKQLFKALPDNVYWVDNYPKHATLWVKKI